ncbi:anthocyanidin 3-O-glucosyltransferase 2 [Amborella trichopoda]|uniref:Glycosyltransferase n=1 Tax=Amborella trichopoda TaxID=13333 RepID=U5DBY4_AMBTC|nr:anthocyanidin 3-O-glucosyltransferase 2 [Amborella trichopoda]ERN19730.1 hypothetical protein AMTR_s00062p00209960 [Amborella trichopoda]|eukprot:XP_006858263.3 anthocyanidin 3-O-glucosyltransferase 2 [Amborella trichopoda]
MDEAAKVQVVVFPLPLVGHLVPTVELAKLLLGHRSLLSITILTPHDHPFNPSSTAPYIERTSSSSFPLNRLRFLQLPRVDFSPAPDMRPQTLFSLFAAAHKPIVTETLKSLSSTSPPVCAFIIDFFCTALLDAAMESGVPAYIFFTSSANSLALMLHLPTLHDQIPCEFKDCKEPIIVPGLPPVPPIDLPLVLSDKTNDAYKWFLYNSRRFHQAKGILINTFLDLETRSLDALHKGICLSDHPSPPVYPVGPLLNLDEYQTSAGEHHKCLQWLDKQPQDSVVFLCFGSLGTLSNRQTKQVALGLEQSGHRFLWSLRGPTSMDQLFDTKDAELRDLLPEGFLERTHDLGMVWPKWAPQAAVLAHPAVGAFVSHCGWNSTLESVWFGVPMVAWPLYAEQRLNALELVREVGVALELKMEEDGWVKAEELERVARRLMEGDEGKIVRKRVKELKEASTKVLEEGGSSYASLASAIHRILKG